eukprot:TRINITY_DN468_c0_g1_i1.p1 TRINITY_DN468_c0_g1~~TRINITY_DN468_c0_g1_i1.p1  ORF type:complete len:395 (-),score=58.11 TRINITY_DN468_c0_g1_i1:790-1974(-)
MTESESCPICLVKFTTNLAEHVNSHFDEVPSSFQGIRETASPVKCPLDECRSLVPVCYWEEHALLHQLEKTPTTPEKINTPITNPRIVQPDSPECNLYTKQYLQALENKCFANKISLKEFYTKKAELLSSLAQADVESRTQDLSTTLLDLYTRARVADRVILCKNFDHFGYGLGDAGWGCGFRNAQVVLSSLLTRSSCCSVLFDGSAHIPTLPKLQKWLERAWAEGFDPIGADELKHRIYGSRKWIGPTEFAVLLRYFGVRCELIDFHEPTGVGAEADLHPTLYKWVWDYFSNGISKKIGGTVIEMSTRTPLFLQEKGHSRTIVGVEKKKDGNINLLIVDPVFSKERIASMIEKRSLVQALRIPMKMMRRAQYQVVCVGRGDDSHEEDMIMRKK